MTDEAERAGLRDRLTALALKEGLKPLDPEALTDAMLANGGLSIHFHQIETDESVSDRLIKLSKRNAALFEQPATPPPVHSAGLPADFIKSLGGLAATWDQLPALRKMQLWDRHCAATGAKARLPSTARPASQGYQRVAALDLKREANLLQAELGYLRAMRAGTVSAQSQRASRIQTVEAKLSALRERGAVVS